MSIARIASALRTSAKKTSQPCLNKRFFNTRSRHHLHRTEPKEPNFSTNPYKEAMDRFKDQAKMVGKMTGYTILSMTTAIAFVWQSSHWYIEYVMHPTPSELGYQARNLLHGAYIRESIAPDFEVASFYVREALRIALEEKHLPESSPTVIDLRLRLAHDEAHAGNLLEAITEYTRAWKLMLDVQEHSVRLIQAAKHVGDLYLRIGDFVHAEEFLAWSLHQLPQDQPLLKSKITLNLASLYAMQRHFQLALPLLSQSLQSVPDEAICLKAIVQNQLSEVMYALGKTDEAMGWAQAALASCAQNVKDQDCLQCGGVASNNLGKMLEMKAEFEKALEHYNQAVTYSMSVHDSESHDRYVLNAERLKDFLASKQLEEN